MAVALSPVDHLLLLLAFNATRSQRFDIDAIRSALEIAGTCASEAGSPEEFRVLLETEVSRFPDWVSGSPNPAEGATL